MFRKVQANAAACAVALRLDRYSTLPPLPSLTSESGGWEWVLLKCDGPAKSNPA